MLNILPFTIKSSTFSAPFLYKTQLLCKFDSYFVDVFPVFMHNGSSFTDFSIQCKHFYCNSGELICAEGEKADNVYIILEGRVKVFKVDESGNEIEIAIIEKGNMFGEMALFDKGVRSACVKSIEQCQFLIFDGQKFLELLLS